jgi:hypothetical protein
MLCSQNELKELLHYKNQAVVNRFKKEYPHLSHQAEIIFEDLLRFFWGTRKHALDKKENPEKNEFQFIFIMDKDMMEIDQMWHIFLLFTRDYASFCHKYFGEFLHHQPDLVPLFENQGFQFKSNLEKFLNYTFDLFGEEVITRWFSRTLNLGPHRQSHLNI